MIIVEHTSTKLSNNNSLQWGRVITTPLATCKFIKMIQWHSGYEMCITSSHTHTNNSAIEVVWEHSFTHSNQKPEGLFLFSIQQQHRRQDIHRLDRPTYKHWVRIYTSSKAKWCYNILIIWLLTNKNVVTISFKCIDFTLHIFHDYTLHRQSFGLTKHLYSMSFLFCTQTFLYEAPQFMSCSLLP